MMSGSWRRSARRPSANSSPAAAFTAIWFTRDIVYSIGSSIVEMFTACCRSLPSRISIE